MSSSKKKKREENDDIEEEIKDTWSALLESSMLLINDISDTSDQKSSVPFTDEERTSNQSQDTKFEDLESMLLLHAKRSAFDSQGCQFFVDQDEENKQDLSSSSNYLSEDSLNSEPSQNHDKIKKCCSKRSSSSSISVNKTQQNSLTSSQKISMKPPSTTQTHQSVHFSDKKDNKSNENENSDTKNDSSSHNSNYTAGSLDVASNVLPEVGVSLPKKPLGNKMGKKNLEYNALIKTIANINVKNVNIFNNIPIDLNISENFTPSSSVSDVSLPQKIEEIRNFQKILNTTAIPIVSANFEADESATLTEEDFKTENHLYAFPKSTVAEVTSDSTTTTSKNSIPDILQKDVFTVSGTLPQNEGIVILTRPLVQYNSALENKISETNEEIKKEPSWVVANTIGTLGTETKIHNQDLDTLNDFKNNLNTTHISAVSIDDKSHRLVVDIDELQNKIKTINNNNKESDVSNTSEIIVTVNTTADELNQLTDSSKAKILDNNQLVEKDNDLLDGKSTTSNNKQIFEANGSDALRIGNYKIFGEQSNDSVSNTDNTDTSYDFANVSENPIYAELSEAFSITEVQKKVEPITLNGDGKKNFCEFAKNQSLINADANDNASDNLKQKMFTETVIFPQNNEKIKISIPIQQSDFLNDLGNILPSVETNTTTASFNHDTKNDKSAEVPNYLYKITLKTMDSASEEMSSVDQDSLSNEEMSDIYEYEITTAKYLTSLSIDTLSTSSSAEIVFSPGIKEGERISLGSSIDINIIPTTQIPRNMLSEPLPTHGVFLPISLNQVSERGEVENATPLNIAIANTNIRSENESLVYTPNLEEILPNVLSMSPDFMVPQNEGGTSQSIGGNVRMRRGELDSTSRIYEYEITTAMYSSPNFRYTQDPEPFEVVQDNFRPFHSMETIPKNNPPRPSRK